jgi:hypothetical protein
MGRGMQKRKQYEAGQWMAWPVLAVVAVIVAVLLLDWLGLAAVSAWIWGWTTITL